MQGSVRGISSLQRSWLIPTRPLQKACATRKTYALDTAWWRENYCVKLAKTTSYIQYRLIQQSRERQRGRNDRAAYGFIGWQVYQQLADLSIC